MKGIASVSLLIATALAAQPRTASPIEGYWKNPIGSAIIAISPCGSVLCGKVVWASARGQREVAKHTSNVVGTTVLTNVKAARGHWAGSLYIPDDNIHVSARLEPIGAGQLKLTGCGLLGLICRTQVWTRVEEPLPSGG